MAETALMLGRYLDITAANVEASLRHPSAAQLALRNPRDVVMFWARVGSVNFAAGSKIGAVRIVPDLASRCDEFLAWMLADPVFEVSYAGTFDARDEKCG